MCHHEKELFAMETVHESMRRHGLVRPSEDRVLGGVCAGLGRRFGFDAWSARLLFVLILLAVPGSQLIIYPILWLMMPSEEATTPVFKTPTS
jgi:phage shock protein PspC (stress-responsive transcriptional regulator)